MIVEDAFRHNALGVRDCCAPVIDVPEEKRDRYARLVDALLAFADLPGVIGHAPPRPARERRVHAAEIDRLAADGTPWPRLGDAWRSVPLVPVGGGLTRRETRRPSRGYCVRWTGAFWAPCFTQRDRRAAGYVPLLMCWPPPIPKAGEYIISGDRARFAYRIAEVERLRPPRGAQRYTCRLWCDRVDPERVPRNATVHRFSWHVRPRKKAA